MSNRCSIPTLRPRTQEVHKLQIERYRDLEINTMLLGDSMFEMLKGLASLCNVGIGGDRTQHVLWRLDQGLLDEIKVKKIILLIGTNNIQSDTSENICEGIIAIVNKIKEINPIINVIVLGILPRNDRKKTEKMNTRVREVNQYLKLHLSEFVDHSELFLIGNKVNTLLYEDHVHLNEEGYKIWCQALLEIS